MATWLGGWVTVCHTRNCIKTAKPIQNFFNSLVAHHSSFLNPGADTQFQGEPLQRGYKCSGWGKLGEIWRFSTEIVVYLGNGAR